MIFHRNIIPIDMQSATTSAVQRGSRRLAPTQFPYVHFFSKEMDNNVLTGRAQMCYFGCFFGQAKK